MAPGQNSWVSSGKGSTSQMLQENPLEQGLKRGHWIKRLGWDPWHYYGCFQWSGEDKRENEWKVRMLVHLFNKRLSSAYYILDCPGLVQQETKIPVHGACMPALFTECPSKNILKGSGRTRDWPVFFWAERWNQGNCFPQAGEAGVCGWIAIDRGETGEDAGRRK